MANWKNMNSCLFGTIQGTRAACVNIVSLDVTKLNVQGLKEGFLND